jgi:MFS family permease
MLLQTGQLLSSIGTQTSSLAYPLLVLAVTQSPTKAGFVAFLNLVALTVLAVPAGLAADRWSRKGLMVASDVIRVLAVGTLGALILLDSVVFWAIALVAFVEAAGAAVFSPGYSGAVRAIVPRVQIPDAIAVQTGRQAVVSLVGPPLGGALFGLGRAIPFLVDAVSYAFSTLSLLAIRRPFEEQRELERSSLRTRIGESFRFLWSHPFLRSSALFFGLANFIGSGVLFAIVVIGTDQGLSGAEVGLLLAAFSVFLLIGSFLSHYVRRVLPVRAVLLLEFWTWGLCGAFLIWPSVYVLTAAVIPSALAIPSTDSVVHGYRIAMTPDRLLGRSESIWRTIALVIAPLGPLLAGALLDAVSARATIAVFAASGLTLAVWATLSHALRAAPSLDELAGNVAHR